MITKSIKHLFIASLLCCGGAAAFTACTDWNDHYDANTALFDSQQATLWENIQANGELSQFASLLKKTGYDAILNESQTYTVWAPVNNSFDYDKLSGMSNERLRKEFIENHIARNNYLASGAINQRVFTLNEKLMHFDGTQNYAIQGINVTKTNLATGNGTIHTLNGMIPFMPNIYESLNSYDYPIDSVSKYIHNFDEKKLNEYKSVKGPTLNGEITYLDSIFDEHNELFELFDIYINVEDSNYSMIAPTNEAWIKAKETVSQYYKYLPSFEFMENTSTGSEKKKVNVTVKNVKYLQDSIVSLMLARDLFYNNNIYDNTKLKNLAQGQTLQCDSLYSTTYSKIYTEDAARLFENAIRIDKSNGILWVTDSLRMRTWTSWNPEIIVEGEMSTYLSSTVNVAGTPERVYVTPGTQNPEVTGKVSRDYFSQAVPASSSTNPGVVYYLPNVRSTTYSIYLVTVPANIINPKATIKPYRFNVSLGYADEKGINQDNDRKWAIESAFVADSAQIDTVYLGDFTFPMAYVGTGSYYPYIRINSAVTSRERANYDRTLRIDCLILRPKELDDYLKAHPDYEYDKGIY